MRKNGASNLIRYAKQVSETTEAKHVHTKKRYTWNTGTWLSNATLLSKHVYSSESSRGDDGS